MTEGIRNFIIVIVTITTMLTLIESVIRFIPAKKEAEVEIEQKKVIGNPMDYEVLMGILIQTIRTEFEHKYNLEYKIKNIKIFYKFEDELSKLVKSTMLAFSDEFLRQLEFYYNREYIIRYVTRSVETLLIEYSRKHGPKAK